MTASVLSPLAQPFHPVMGEYVQPTIYNNGIPSMTVTSSEHEFLSSITDDVLDDAFPPTAEEAAELEETEFFVTLMANLAMLEEKEETARSLHDGLKKRWQARRGLAGKPRAPLHSVKKVHHGTPSLIDSHDLVVIDPIPLRVENRMRAKEQSFLVNPNKMNKKIGAKLSQKKPIQQPRKNS
eukprot:CAMPEP_0176010740 /NCGR_PEP_ID=MMETSP0120_2-20121206/4928_1 /TAXON_ID=160619 /ORGANISM="Kryptoperidinium foliaceum, Strain CCMP 1326" /LENGTH=181 /DNA_ID=CAMNT_0017343589 /DNA_START=9 /DNA_END=554 /DNA_ORIENTATION=-